jgi:HK97 gp10 family phage protein
MSFNINLAALDELRAKLRAYGEVVKDEVAIEGAAGMGRVIYEEARANVHVSSKPHYFYGSNSKKSGTKYLFNPGNLRNAIYRVYSPEKSSDTLKMYRVSWNHTKAPYGAMVEFGTSRAAAKPFMGPSLSRLDDAITAGKKQMAAKLDEIQGR